MTRRLSGATLRRKGKNGKFENKASAHAIARFTVTEATAAPGKTQVAITSSPTWKGAASATRIRSKDHVRPEPTFLSLSLSLDKSLQEATRPFAAAATRYARSYLLYSRVSFCFLLTLVGEMRIRRASGETQRDSKIVRSVSHACRAHERINHAFQPLSPFHGAFRRGLAGQKGERGRPRSTRCVL